MDQTTGQQYLAYWTDERNGAALYRALAEVEKNPKLAEVYRRLAATEDGHAANWEEKLTAAHSPVPPFKIAPRTRMLIALSKRLGVIAVLPALASMEKDGNRRYHLHGLPAMAAAEQSHARLLKTISQSTSSGLEGGAVAQLEGRHRLAGGNALRAAVLGANDGLVSNFSLVMGVAGAAVGAHATDSHAVLVTGVAGLLAGAISMALGEWLSVTSSRELYENQIAIERDELAGDPESEREELTLIYQAKGMSPEEARKLAGRLLDDPEKALDTLSREDLGINPEDLGGSAWEAALTSFFLFAGGAVLPVLPYVLTKGMPALAWSVVLSTLGLFGVGAFITLFTGKNPLWSGARMMVFGLAAAAVTFGIGRLIGVQLGG